MVINWYKFPQFEVHSEIMIQNIYHSEQIFHKSSTRWRSLVSPHQFEEIIFVFFAIYSTFFLAKQNEHIRRTENANEMIKCFLLYRHISSYIFVSHYQFIRVLLHTFHLHDNITLQHILTIWILARYVFVCAFVTVADGDRNSWLE